MFFILQAVHSVVRVDEFPVNTTVALQLAGLQAQILWGEADPSKATRYEELERYIPWRIRQQQAQMGKKEWMQNLYTAHTTVGSGKTDMQAKVLYLTAIMQYPLYGGTFFEVQYKGFWAFPNKCEDVFLIWDL
jgi:myosin-7